MTGQTLQVNVANLLPNDGAFLRSIIAMFTDRNHAHILDGIRSGEFGLHYNDRDHGFAYIFPLDGGPCAPVEILQFVDRFTAEEWQDLIRAVGDRALKELMKLSLPQVEARVRQHLGYLPAPRRELQISNG